MIITRTPFRISFFGGGTDYPAYYREHGGAVLSATINKYCYVMCRYLPPFFDHKFRIRYTRREETQTIEQIRHPSVRECLKLVGIKDGVEIVHTSDIPAMSGIGSSSAFTVGLLHALYALQGQMVTKRKLAFDAIHVEQDLIGEHVGSQDQVAAAFGGINRVNFSPGAGEILVEPVVMEERRRTLLQEHMLLYFTGFSRVASEIAGEQLRHMQSKLKELAVMRALVDEAVRALDAKSESMLDFGKLLHETWTLKRTLSPRISTSEIDGIYDTAMRAGALGGKLCGAGGGGFILFFVPPDRKKDVMAALDKLLLVPFRFENLGSHIVYYSA